MVGRRSDKRLTADQTTRPMMRSSAATGAPAASLSRAICVAGEISRDNRRARERRHMDLEERCYRAEHAK